MNYFLVSFAFVLAVLFRLREIPAWFIAFMKIRSRVTQGDRRAYELLKLKPLDTRYGFNRDRRLT